MDSRLDREGCVNPQGRSSHGLREARVEVRMKMKNRVKMWGVEGSDSSGVACFHLLLGESQVTCFVCSYLKYTDDIFVFNPVIRQNYLRDQIKCVFKREEGRVVHFSPNAAPSSCPTYT